MLLYHPFFDPHHCVFRILRLLNKTRDVEIEYERLRVWDFYLLFPAALQKAVLPQNTRRIRNLVQKWENRYEILPDPRRAFDRLEPIQNAALAHLASTQVIDGKKLREGKVLRTKVPIPEELTLLIGSKNEQDELLMTFLTTTFFELPLFGKGGIRTRTDLFDHRYDIS
jgi:ABC-three component (ABC-3C) system Middle Component 5